jgi:hypothetical protein
MNAIYGQLEVEQMKKPATTIITNYMQRIKRKKKKGRIVPSRLKVLTETLSHIL